MHEPSAFVPPGLDCTSWLTLEPLYNALIHRPVRSEPEFWEWLRDYSELSDVVGESCAWSNIRHTCHTDDPAVEQAFMHVVKHIEPRIAPLHFSLQKKFLAEVDALGLHGDPRVAHLARRWQGDVEAYREKNIPLQVRDTTLAAAYDKACGAMTVEYRGEPRTLQQLAKHLDDTSRAVRETVWQLIAQRWLRDRGALNAVFDELVQVRDEMAHNAGHPDYRSYIWLVKNRVDYTPEMCLEFGDSIERLIVPLIHEMDCEAAHNLNVPILRPWDTAVDSKGRPPLRPFAQSDMPGFVAKTRQMFSRVSPYFEERFATMTLGETLDLDSRAGKQPGGYQAWLPKSRTPFIFMNAVGSQRDVEILLHEGGHAFHSLEASDYVDVTFARRAPIEFAEVASMSMELLSADAYDEFYSADDALRAKRLTIEGAIRRLALVATIDGFQHWVYTHPRHTHEQRTTVWLSLLDRFASRAVDWSGLEEARSAAWQRHIHLFAYPFYFVEYGIAQLGALQLWLQFQQDPGGVVGRYRQALALGGTRPLRELFDAAGLSFDFSAQRMAPLVAVVRDELAALPSRERLG